MSVYQPSTVLRTESGLSHAVKALSAEAQAVLAALASPATFITEGQTMRQLLQRAKALECSQPLEAQALRERAARIWR